MFPVGYYVEKRKTLYIPSVIFEINYIKSIEILAIFVFSVFFLFLFFFVFFLFLFLFFQFYCMFFCLLNLNLFNWRLITLNNFFHIKLQDI